MSEAKQYINTDIEQDALLFDTIQNIMRDIFIVKDEMAKGYEEMAEINLYLSEMCFEIESEVEKSIQKRINGM